MKLNFLYQIIAASRTPDQGGYHPQIPFISVLCPQLNLLTPRTKFLGKPLVHRASFSQIKLFYRISPDPQKYL